MFIHEHQITEQFADLEEERMGVRGYHNEKAMKFVETHSNEGKRLFAMIEALGLSFPVVRDARNLKTSTFEEH